MAEELGPWPLPDLFADQRSTSAVLPDLTEDDLARLKLPLGHPKKLLRPSTELFEPEANRISRHFSWWRSRPDAAATLTVSDRDMVESTALPPI